MNLGKNLQYPCEAGFCNQNDLLWHSEGVPWKGLGHRLPLPTNVSGQARTHSNKSDLFPHLRMPWKDH